MLCRYSVALALAGPAPQTDSLLPHIYRPFCSRSPSLRHQFAWFGNGLDHTRPVRAADAGGSLFPHLASSRARRPRTARSARSALPRGKAAAIAGAAYGLYSWVVLRRLAPRYAAMRCLAAIAAPTPNAAEIAELAEALRPRRLRAADEAWEQLWPAGAPTGLEAKRSGWRDAGDDAIAVRREGAAWKVFARQGDGAAPPGPRAADPARPVVPELRACAGRARCAPDDGAAAARGAGPASFVFRDYVNSEELSGMAAARVVERRSCSTTTKTRLGVAPDGRVSLRERFRLLSFLPLTIRWTGEQAGGEFRWTATEASAGAGSAAPSTAPRRGLLRRVLALPARRRRPPRLPPFWCRRARVQGD